MARYSAVGKAGGSGTSSVNIVQFGGTSVSLGQTTMSASMPVVIASNQGALPVSQSGSWTVSISGNVSAVQSGTWNIGTVTSITDTVDTVTLPQTSGGLSFTSGSITTTVTAVKTSAGQLYGWYIFNSNSSTVYCQIFNKATGSVTLGTTAPDLSFGIPAGAGANVFTDVGIAFGTAISIAFTTTRTGSTAPSNSVDYNFFYD